MTVLPQSPVGQTTIKKIVKIVIMKNPETSYCLGKSQCARVKIIVVAKVQNDDVVFLFDIVRRDIVPPNSWKGTLGATE